MEPTPVCERWQVALSALMDGEEPTIPDGALLAHLAKCPDCSAWLDQAARLGRGMHELPVIQPDLGERMVDSVDVYLCACRTGGACLCGNCQCGAGCTCHA